MTGTSETQTTPQMTPVILPAEQPTRLVDTEVFCKDNQPGCSTRFHDIIYVTGQRRFWLLPKRLTDQLKESASQLKEKTVDTDKATRMSNIADAGLLDYFLTPGPEAFLEDDDGGTGERHRYLESRNAIAEDTDKRAQCRQQWFAARAQGDSTAAMHAEREMFRAKQRIEKHEKNMSDLEQVSNRRAEALGYKRENGVFYTPRALEARDAMKRYLVEREKAVAEGFDVFDFRTNSDATVWQFLKHYKALREKLTGADVVDENALKGVQETLLILEKKVEKYVKAIVELAEYGIAVPEFALSPDDVYAGTEAFQAYCALLTERAALEKRIDARYSEWVSATGGKAAPPGALFSGLQDQWRTLNARAEQLKNTAEARVRHAMPPRLFVWEPENYKPKPLERLAKSNFPLRELSSASSTSMLNHISLKYLARETSNTLTQALNDLKAMPKPMSNAADEDRAFSDWLKAGGAHPLAEKGPWFDSLGLFQPDIFFGELKKANFTVDSLESADKRQRWGDTLKAMVFEDKQLRNLMLFDNSPQAQLMRSLLPEGSSVQSSVSVTGPKWQKGLQLTGANVALDVTAWRGEVNLLNVELPKRSEAQSLLVDYTAYDGSVRTLDFGKLSLTLSAKAWGFAGASLMLSRSLTLDQASGFTSLAGVDVAQRRGEVGTFDLFVGAQAGCKVAGELSWCPPASVLPPAPIPNRAPFSAWRPLARLEVELVAAVGAGYSGNLMLSMKDGRFLLSIKAGLIVGAGIKGYMTFEVGYESVIALAELVRKEMAASRYKDLEWVDGEALAYLRDLSFLGATGIDVAFAYIRGYSMVKAVYDALNDGGRGGLIAYALMEDKNYHVMNDWVVNLQPQAFGPLLLALSSPPKAFSVEATEGRQAEEFEVDDAHYLQQRAIERCISWISQKINATQQFEEAVICMNHDGVRPEQAGLEYCKNRLHLDLFMAGKVKMLVSVSE
ncbi:hypothetical protein [Pseudomonas abietaniphila]|uniref:hypothetical protein n=1 Tax=Pseudomonas abietaniphila TaxID=89065 RepID=UPI000781FC2B|nr:hypothetical protein [Pseudomonas abietaniphila]